MRKSLWIILVVLVVAVGAPIAHADSFSVTFTNTLTTVAAPTASDVTFPSPTLDIMWQGLAFALTLPSSSLPTDTYSWLLPGFSCSIPPNTVCVAEIGIVDSTTGVSTDSNQVVVPATFGLGGGPLTFASVAAPEPSSVALMLLGVGLVIAMRKRTGAGLSRAS